jgi:hypothetical protein
MREGSHLLCWVPQKELTAITLDEVKKTPTLLGSLERPNLSHVLEVFLSKGPNRVGVSLPSPEGGSRSRSAV